MKNGQLKPAYNVQIGVEGEYIVGIDISSERSDQLTFIPFLDKLEKNLNKKYKSITADAGYESEENYTYLENNNQKAFIKPQTYEKSKTKKFKNDISKRENMHYNQEDDYYICAAGKKLLPKGFTTRKSKSNFKSIVNIYECESCLGCEYKNKCTKAKNNRQLHVPKEFLRLRSESLANITTKEGIRLRINRSIQVVTNLLENAIKYSEDNGQIEVNISTKGEKIYVSIFNSGETISPEDINHIWDRFYKSDKSRTNKISTGLGLPIVRLILTQHNQDVWVNNVEGKGVKFTFTLQRNS